MYRNIRSSANPRQQYVWPIAEPYPKHLLSLPVLHLSAINGTRPTWLTGNDRCDWHYSDIHWVCVCLYFHIFDWQLDSCASLCHLSKDWKRCSANPRLRGHGPAWGVEGYSVAPGQHCVSDKLNLCIFKYPICFYFHNVNRVHTEISHWTVDKADVRLYGLGDRADLVHFEQQAVAGSLLSSFLYSLGVGHRQVIPNNLDPHLGRQARPGLPVILVKRVLDGHHWKWKRRGLLLINRGTASAN